MSDRPPRLGVLAVSAGIVSALLSALATGFLLLINGALVLVLLGSAASITPPWLSRDGVLQFLLFLIPLVLVVVEWMIWDFVSGFFGRHGSD
ncbi:MAG: hypothetical protein AAFU85_31875 [Planctomycetota bacterium]